MVELCCKTYLEERPTAATVNLKNAAAQMATVVLIFKVQNDRIQCRNGSKGSLNLFHLWNGVRWKIASDWLKVSAFEQKADTFQHMEWTSRMALAGKGEGDTVEAHPCMIESHSKAM
jgi:hypothetical protein